MPLNGFAVYLTNQTTKEKIELPVNPSEVKLSYETDDSSHTIINLGEINNVGKVKLTSITISSVFPKKKARYVSSKKFWKPDTYIKKLKAIQNKKQKVRLVIASTKISVLMTISKFEYGFENGFADEYTYELQLKQYRSYKYKKIKSPKSKSKKNRSSPAKKVGVGSIVIVNGRLHRDSYGSGPGVYEKNAKRKITYMAPGRAYPIHVALVNGGPRGWVKKSEVRKA